MSRGDTIDLKDLPEEFKIISYNEGKGIEFNEVKTIRELERDAIIEALKRCKGNKSKASKILGISRKAFYKRLKEFRHDNVFLKELNTLSSLSKKTSEEGQEFFNSLQQIP